MVEKKALVPSQKLDSESPATRLLDKRRKMYENQEAYIAKKKHYTQQEFEFQTREAELREEDQKLQTSLIQYATFLDNNAKVMRTCDQNIAKLKEENKQRDAEIERKKNQLKILSDKQERIKQQKKAVDQYQSFLEKVKSENNEGYSEVSEISNRHKTLDNESKNLDRNLHDIGTKLKDKKNEVSAYERSMENKIMQLNNDIASLTKECDVVEANKSQLLASEEEISAKKWDQISELSQVIFAIDMIEQLCSQESANHKTSLHYTAGTLEQKNYDTFSRSEETAMKQLDHIGQYMKDFRAILDGFRANRPAGRPGAAAIPEEESEDDE